MSYINLPDITTNISKKADPSNFLAGAAGLLDSIYRIATNERDFDYQKALQQQIFEREDTAVQRRMEDMKAAGINPNLAAGSAASAGSIVGRSDTPGSNMGAALDNLAAVSQIKAQRIQNQILTYQKNMARMQEENAAWQYDFDNDWYRYLYNTPEQEDFNREINPRLYQYFDNILKDQNNSSSILQKQNDWFTTNQILNAASSVAGDISLFTPRFIHSRRGFLNK